MQYSYDIATLTHLFLIWILVASDIYIYYVIAIKQAMTSKKIQDIRLVLPFMYTITSIVFFTGLSLSFLNISIDVFVFDFHYAYMIFAILFFLISKIKIYKMTKTITPIKYKEQTQFIEYAKKMILRSGTILIVGMLI